jgi:DNA polymerase-3 subunit delta'
MRINRGVHPDVRSLQIPGDRDESLGLPLESLEKVSRAAERSIGIEQVRALQHDASLAPSEADWKVYQILGAELLTIPAANCLLKTLEEPPRNVVLILTAPTGSDLLPTIVSRCQSVRFGLVSTADIALGLRTIHGVDPDRAEVLARLAGGRPGWAIEAATNEDLLRERDRAIDDLVAAARPGFRSRLAVAEKVAAGYSKDQAGVQQTISLWQAWWWDVHLAQIGCRDLIANVDRQIDLESFAGQVSEAKVVAYIRELVIASQRLVQNVNPRLTLEALLLSSPVVP